MKLYLILLAAGDSKRFHGNKLLHDFQGKPMYRHVVDEVEGLGDEVFAENLVVTQYEAIETDLRNAGYTVIHNEHSDWGISYSIRLALDYLKDKKGACCFAVCDQPWLKGETIRQLADGWKMSGKGIGALSHEGHSGNPVIFTEKYREELAALTGDVGGKRVLKRHEDDVYLLEVSGGEQLRDIDVREDDKKYFGVAWTDR